MGLKEAGLRGSLRNVSVGVSEIPDGPVDNFEAALYGDQNRTLSDYYSGDLSNASRINNASQAAEGDYYLEIPTGSTSNGISSVKGTSTTDLPWYPKPGFVWRFWVYPDSEDAHIYHARQTEDGNRDGDGYTTFVSPNRGEFSLYRDGKFGGTELASTAISVPSEAWYEVEISWAENGDQVCTLFESDGTEVTQISANDSTYTDEGIAWVANNNNNNLNLRFDDMRPTETL